MHRARACMCVCVCVCVCGMDSNGCGGVRGTGGQENKANRGTDGRAGHVWYVMAGEIPPKKYARTDIEGVRMGAAVAAAAAEK